MSWRSAIALCEALGARVARGLKEAAANPDWIAQQTDVCTLANPVWAATPGTHPDTQAKVERQTLQFVTSQEKRERRCKALLFMATATDLTSNTAETVSEVSGTTAQQRGPVQACCLLPSLVLLSLIPCCSLAASQHSRVRTTHSKLVSGIQPALEHLTGSTPL